MDNYITVTVPPDLLPQVTGELLQFTRNANLVEVVHTDVGRVIHADPGVVDAWMEWRKAKEEGTATPVTEPEPEPEPELPVPTPEPEAVVEAPVVPAPEPVPAPVATAAPVPTAPKKQANAASA